MIHELKYDWILEGDVELNVSLLLHCDCRVQNLTLHSVNLVQVECDAVALSYRRDQLQLPGPTMTDASRGWRDWFARQFRRDYESREIVRDEIRGLIEHQALNAHWERHSAA